MVYSDLIDFYVSRNLNGIYISIQQEFAPTISAVGMTDDHFHMLISKKIIKLYTINGSKDRISLFTPAKFNLKTI